MYRRAPINCVAPIAMARSCGVIYISIPLFFSLTSDRLTFRWCLCRYYLCKHAILASIKFQSAGHVVRRKKSRDFDESLEARIKKSNWERIFRRSNFIRAALMRWIRRRYERSRFLRTLYEISDSDISHADERLTELINAITGFFRNILSYLRQIYLYLL